MNPESSASPLANSASYHHRRARRGVSGRLVLGGLIALLALLGGCTSYYGDGYYDGGYVDAEVYWDIDGSDDEQLCAFYGIDRWEISISGPEVRANVLDCVDFFWSSEDDFYELEPGVYTIEITAVDSLGAHLVTLQQTAAFTDPDVLYQTDVAFTDLDFP